LNNILFGEKPEDSNMSDEIWETYWILTSVCNSLNAYEGIFARKSAPFVMLNENNIAAIRHNLEKAQETIMFLLNETGRLKRFNEWQEQQNDR